MIWEVEDEDCAISSSPHFISGAFRFMRSEQALGVWMDRSRIGIALGILRVRLLY